MNVEVRFKDGVTDKRVKRKRMWADDVAEVRVANSKSEATVEPEFHQGYHGVSLAAFGDETSHQVRALASCMAVCRNERGDGGVVEGGDEDLDILRVCCDMPLR